MTVSEADALLTVEAMGTFMVTALAPTVLTWWSWPCMSASELQGGGCLQDC